MSKALGVVLVAACLIGGSAPVLAQSLDIGPGGPRLDLRNRGEREYDRDRESRHEDRYERQRSRCRMVETRERDDDGDVVVRRRRECRD